MPENKTNIVRKLLAEGSHKRALSIAKSFKLGINKEDSNQLNRAYECLVHRKFYEQIGKDPEQEIIAGLLVLNRFYGVG